VVNPSVEHYNVTRRWKHALFILFPHHTLDETAWQIYRLLSRPVVFSDVVAPCTPELTAIVNLLFDIALVQLSVALLRALYGNHSGRTVSTSTTAAQSQMARVVDLIHSAFRTDLSLHDLAAAAAMSRYHFLRCFKIHVGTTPYADLQHVRLQCAAALLRSTSRTITDIALDCGFTSPSRFSDTFRRRYGLHLPPIDRCTKGFSAPRLSSPLTPQRNKTQPFRNIALVPFVPSVYSGASTLDAGEAPCPS
jgi:AraC-like DNA-binding protein